MNTNRTSQAAQEIIMVGSGDQNLVVTGVYKTSGNTVNLASGQFGVLSADRSGTIAPDAYLAASTTANDVSAIKVVCGTPNSTNLKNVSAFGVNAPAALKTPVIHADQIVSVVTKKPVLPAYQAIVDHTFTAPTAEVVYESVLTLQSMKRDISFSWFKRDQTVNAAVSVPTGTVAPTDYLLQNLVEKLNLESQYVTGSKPFVVLGLDYGGSGGTDLGTIAPGDTINFLTYNGVTYSITADATLVNTFRKAIATDASLATAEIVTVDTTGAGAAETVDRIMTIGLNEADAIVFDEFMQEKVRAEVAIDLAHTRQVVSTLEEDSSSAKFWNVHWRKNAAFNAHSMLPVGHTYDLKVTDQYNPISQTPTDVYTATTITYYSKEDTLTKSNRQPNKLTILLPGEYSAPSAAANAANVGQTADSGTVTSIDAVLGFWLDSASDLYGRIQFLQDASNANPFV